MMATEQRARADHRGDTLLFFLFLVASMTLPWSIDATKWAPQGYRMMTPAAVAAVVALFLARSPLPSFLAGFLGTALGVEFTLQFVGGILPKAVLVWRDLRELGGWAWEFYLTHQPPEAIAPFARSLAHMTSQGAEMRMHLVRWAQAVQAGEVTRDTTSLRLGLALLIWVVVLYGGLELFRRRRALLALLPLGVAVISNVAYTGIGITYVYLYLTMALLIMVWAYMSRLEASWQRRGIDFSAHLRGGAMTTGFFLSGAIVLAALLAPYIRYDRAINYFWEAYGPHFEDFYDRLDRAFAGRNPVPTATPNPRSLGGHAVVSAPVLERKDVFIVRVSDPAPLPPEEYDEYMHEAWLEREAASRLVPKRYWRERTYDAYTGRGWENTTQQADDWAADVAWTEDLPETSAPLTQTYTIVGDVAGLAFAVNEPVLVEDHAYTVIRRDRNDFVALTVAAEQYTVVSQAPDITAQDLQEAESPYPTWIADRYLSLENVPERVQQTARDVVAEVGAETRYQKARAIEAYLRQFRYDLQVPSLPRNTDLVEYLLFDTGAGFCDHTASAMVVMLRAVGVAARYASGYNQGYYDHYRGGWVVQEVNAHAWPEVYFPGHGWIEFEPTPSQSTFVRPARPDAPEEIALPAPPPIPEELQSPADEEITLSPTWALTALLIVVGVYVILRPPRFLQGSRKRVPAQAVYAAYRGLLRQAGWLGLAPVGGQTTSEYVRYLKAELGKWDHQASGLDQDIDIIGGTYQRLRYSNAGVTRAEGDSAERAYARVRRPLFRLFLARALRRSLLT